MLVPAFIPTDRLRYNAHAQWSIRRFPGHIHQNLHQR